MTQLFLDYEKSILSKEQLNKLKDINEIQMSLLECIEGQDETLNRIEYNMSSIKNNMDESVDHLKDADKNTIFYTPILIGGIVGSILVSPVIGLVGLKSGMLFYMTGGIIGGISGYKIQ